MMLQEFVDIFIAHRNELEEYFQQHEPADYGVIVKETIGLLRKHGAHLEAVPDPERITEVDHGDYQGTLVFVVGEEGYQPSTYWTMVCSYGSCSGCDTIEKIMTIKTTTGRAREYADLALHLIQKIKEV